MIGSQNSASYSLADIERRQRLAEALLGRNDDFQARDPFGALAKGLQGAIGGYQLFEANEDEKKGRASATSDYNRLLAQMLGAGSETSSDPHNVPGVVNDSFAAAGSAVDPVMQRYFANVGMSESGGDPNARNPNSSATGLFQFTTPTWDDLSGKHPELGLTSDGRSDPNQQQRAMQAFTADNAGALTGAGIDPTPANLYAAHFLGAGGATGVLQQSDETPMVAAVPAEVIKANPFLADMSVGDFRSWAARKAGEPGSAAPGYGGGTSNKDGRLAQLLEIGGNEFLTPNQAAMVNVLLGREIQPPKVAESYRTITDTSERATLGIPADDRGVYQIDQTGQLNKVGGGGVNVNLGGEGQYDKTLNENLAKTFVGTQDASTNGLKTLTTLDAMTAALDDPSFYSGFASEPTLAVKRLAASLGLDPSAATSMEAFNALSKQSALDLMGGSLGAGFSNADRSFVVDQTASLGATPEGNRALIEMQRKLAQRQIDIGKLASKYAADNNGRLDQNWATYLADWAEANPVFPQEDAGGAGAASALPDPFGMRAEPW